MLNGVSIKPLGLLAFGAIESFLRNSTNSVMDLTFGSSFRVHLSSLSLGSITQQFFQAVFSKFSMVSSATSGCNAILPSPLCIVSSGGSDSVPHH